MPDKKPFVQILNEKPEYQPLLDGTSHTFGMKSGRVYLKPGETCGEHTTGEREEMLVFLEGKGRAFIEKKETMEVGKGKISYIPPHTIHNIENNSDEPLIYIYCVAPARHCLD